MDQAFVSALVGLSAAIIGSGASFATTYLTRRTELREQRAQRLRRERQQLYGSFISEASRLYGDALGHEKDDAADLVAAYALLGQMRLTAPGSVLTAAEQVLETVAQTYIEPVRQLHELHVLASKGGMDPLEAFAVACRDDLSGCNPTARPAGPAWFDAPFRDSSRFEAIF